IKDPVAPDITEKDCVRALRNQITRGTFISWDEQVRVTTNLFGLKTQVSVSNIDMNEKICPFYSHKFFQYHLKFTETLEHGIYGVNTFPLIYEETCPNNPDRGPSKVPDYTMYQNRFLHQKFLADVVIFGVDPDTFCYDYAATLFSLVELTSYDTPMLLDAAETKRTIDRPYKINYS
uniref:Uncharacterized protein n=1 Tax=Panagrolaimus sp. ES5 TaxID=591445 RepID=A0AC34F738_9BILA